MLFAPHLATLAVLLSDNNGMFLIRFEAFFFCFLAFQPYEAVKITQIFQKFWQKNFKK